MLHSDNSICAILTRTISLIQVLVLLISFGCSKENGSDSPDPEEIEKINSAVLLQEDAYDQLAEMLESTDTATAKNAVLEIILKDPLVESAGINSQGLYIQYNSGMRGGLIIDFEDDPNDTIMPLDTIDTIDTMTESNLKSAPATNIIPADEHTIFLNPHYFERERWTDRTLPYFNNRLPLAGFLKPEIYLNEECTVERFTSLENYGIVYIYSHGWAWPSSSNINTVYLMTGEMVSELTTNLYWRNILNGEIPLITISERSHKYFLSPKFIAANNNFSEDTTLIYGAFCYSFLGGWPESMVGAGAGGYMGVNWAVQSRYCHYWAWKFLLNMTDENLIVPLTIRRYLEKFRNYLYYTHTLSPYINTYLRYQGYPDLALMKSEVRVDLTQINEVQCDLMPTLQWTCSTPNLTVQKIVSQLKITNRKIHQDWDYETTFTGSIPVYVSGELYLEFSDTFEKLDSFFVYNTWNFNAKDEDLQIYGYPNVKTQIYSGHDLPIWVNEPDFERYIYGVQGSEAINYLSTLECSYEFPKGSSCSIKKFEFTDDAMQMIRFDFHIR